MTKKRAWMGLLLVIALLGSIPIHSVAGPEVSEPAQDGQNLLKNPGFEGLSCAANSEPGWCNDNWTHDAHDGSTHGNIFTPQGWVSWWRKGGDYGQPEIKTIPKVDPFIGPPARIRGGNYSVLLFTFHRNQDTGLYQVVTGLQPGATVQFSAHAQGWSCDQDGTALSCGDQYNQSFQVGIEPNGLADPFSPSVVWSPEQWSPDAYRRIGPVTAQVGASGNVVVYLRSKTKWPYKHLDAYWDDTSLVMTTPGQEPTATPPPVPPTATPGGPTATPRPEPTARPDGAVVHIVESGDTLSSIALEYDVTVDQIRELNAGSIGDNNLIVVGQELVISGPAQAAATPTALPEAPTAAPTTAPEATEPEEAEQPAPQATPVDTTGASICVLAYHDRDGDTLRTAETEELLPNAEFVLANASGVLDRYTSDGISEPYCFTGLGAGAYRVIQNTPPGYEASGPVEWPAALAEGTQLELQFGNVRTDQVGGNVTPEDAEAAPDGDSETSTSSLAKVFQTVARVSGILVLALAAGVAVLFVVTRRRV
jgi:LysM repeat protein